MATTFSIHPSIGVARLGNAPTATIFAPEEALALPTEVVGGIEQPVSSFRDAQGRIKREVARFRVYRSEDGQVGSHAPLEIGRDGLVDIEWTVWVANKKAQWYQFQGLSGDQPGRRKRRNGGLTGDDDRCRLIIDPGPRTVRQGAPTASFSAADAPVGHPVTFPPAPLRPFSVETLGNLRIDAQGVLHVLAGAGASGSTAQEPKITDYANNDTWFDDVADGPVTATLVFDDGRRIVVEHGAWVICAPPAYAPEVGNVVTLYDVMFDVAVRHLGLRPDIFANGQFRGDYSVDFEDELRPFFRRLESIEAVERRMPSAAHLLNWHAVEDSTAASAPHRKRILEVIRAPSAPDATHTVERRLMMPYALGDNPYSNQAGASKFLTVTEVQYFLLSQWAAGRFHAGTEPVAGPLALDRAVLDNCVGGAFFPGIETTWIVREPRIYAAPWRIKHRTDLQNGLHLDDDLDQGLEPGDLTKRMALPWQADFNECYREHNSGLLHVAWWPAQRPLSVLNERFERVEWSRGIPVSTPGDIDMVRHWMDLGFVRSRRIGRNRVFVEVERNDANIAGGIA
jgi:hypothetical protein